VTTTSVVVLSVLGCALVVIMVWGFRLAGSGPIVSRSSVKPEAAGHSSLDVIGAVVVEHSEPALQVNHEEFS
jgi:hypothetical protein